MFQIIFTSIPLVSTVAFLPSVFSASSLTEWLLSLWGVLSLLGTAYTMRLSPLHPDRKGKKTITAENERIARLHSALFLANGAVCLMLAAAYFLAGTGSSSTIRPVLYLIPGGMFLNVHSLNLFSFSMLTICSIAMLAAILLARETILSVDITALKDLQYEYKGA